MCHDGYAAVHHDILVTARAACRTGPRRLNPALGHELRRAFGAGGHQESVVIFQLRAPLLALENGSRRLVAEGVKDVDMHALCREQLVVVQDGRKQLGGYMYYIYDSCRLEDRPC